MLKVHLTAVPEKGKANDSLVRLLAKTFGVSPGKVEIVKGERSREKTLRLKGVEVATLQERLGVKVVETP